MAQDLPSRSSALPTQDGSALDDPPAVDQGLGAAGRQRRTVLGGLAAAATGLAVPPLAQAVVKGNTNTASWAASTDPNIYAQAFARRFTNPFFNALDRKVLGIGAFYRPDPGCTDRYTVSTSQAWQTVLGIPGLGTRIWGYHNHESGPTFPGRSFEVRTGQRITVRWRNQLRDASGPLPHILPVDQTITPQQISTGVPLATHHHGGDTAAAYDGGPDQWATPYRAQVGPGIAADNSQGQLATDTPALSFTYEHPGEASMHWYHDHAQGLTRINVGAGLAGLYIVRDANEDRLIAGQVIPGDPYEMAVVLQDRSFDRFGQFSYTAQPLDYPGGLASNFPRSNPTHMPEMFGDVIVVNGQAWPMAQIEARPYRVRLLNGSDSRFYTLDFGARTGVYQIGTDLGLLNKGVRMGRVTIAPGERVDLVLDFSPYGGWNSRWSQPPVDVDVTNSAPAPFPAGTPPSGGTALVMRFRVNKTLNTSVPMPSASALPGTNLRPLLGPHATTMPPIAATRRILLAEGVDNYGRILPLLGVYDPSGAQNHGTLAMHDPITETPRLNTYEVWEFWNASADAHPVHMHLVRFRLLNREGFSGTVAAKVMNNGWEGVRLLPGARLAGQPAWAPAHEVGWKDTVNCPPGQVTRVVVPFTRRGRYVYHCHILSHEEHDMMRFYQVL